MPCLVQSNERYGSPTAPDRFRCKGLKYWNPAETLEPRFYSLLVEVTDPDQEKQVGTRTLAQQVSINRRRSEIALTGRAVNLSSTPSAAHGTITKQRLNETVPSVAAIRRTRGLLSKVTNSYVPETLLKADVGVPDSGTQPPCATFLLLL